VIAIPGTSNRNHLEENARAVDIILDDVERARLDNLT
jgi:diketogulonate reductase-like aldo/keto reductase